MATLRVLLWLAPLLLAGCGGSGGAPPPTAAPRPLTEILPPQGDEGTLVEWTFRGTRLQSLGGDDVTLAARPVAAYFSGLAPLVTASASGRRIAYSSGTVASDLRVRIRDLRGGGETALAAGTTGAAWRADGSLAYFRGAERDGRLRGRLFVQRIGRDRMAAAPVAWTREEGKYFPFGWAGGRLVFLRMGEGEHVETFVADAPGRTRRLAAGAPIAISPDGARVLIHATGDGSGRDLVLVDLATGRTAGRLRAAPLRSGDWRRDLVVAAGGDGVVVLRVQGDRITTMTRIPLAGRSGSEPRFTGTGLRRVVVSTSRDDGTEAAPAVCVVATARCLLAASTRGLEQQHVVYTQSVASPTG